MTYNIIRTDAADSRIRNIILYIAEKLGRDTALRKLNALEKGILALADNPDIGMEPGYLVLKRQGYKVLILEKTFMLCKVNKRKKEVTVHTVVDQRRDYLAVICGL